MTDFQIEAEVNQPSVPVFNETVGGALIDAARINVMAAATAFPHSEPVIVMPGQESDEPVTIAQCLAEAAQWLDAARALSIQAAATPATSLHTVGIVDRMAFAAQLLGGGR